METITTEEAPPALGHYSQGMIAGDFIFTAMQLPLDPDNLSRPKGSIEEQTEQLIENVFCIVRAGNADIADIVKVTIYLSDISFWEDINAVYTKKFEDHKPARSVVAVKALHKGYDVAMEAIAYCENKG